jgi:transmembrane sensor
MSELRYPLKERLHDVVTERALQRVWSGIDDRQRARAPRRLARGLLLLAFAGLAVAIGVVLGLALRAREPAPPRMADGRPFAAVDAATRAVLALDDGSAIRLWPGTRLEPLEGGAAGAFGLRLVRGEARFDVRAGGPRRWLVECGLASVEAVDAEFHCARGASRLRVSVERGTALAKGEAVPEHMRWLSAGDSLELGETEKPAE